MTLQLIKHKESEERRRLDENKMAAIGQTKMAAQSKFSKFSK